MKARAARIVAGEVIREHLVQNGQIDIPIDPIGLAETLNISVSRGVLASNVSGVIVKEDSEDFPRIILNRSDALVRQRFTCAHELGHYFSRLEDGIAQYGYIDERSDLASTGSDPQERWANQFAAELLMPGFAVRQFFTEGWSQQRLARELKVSEAAMGYRLTNLGLA